MENKKKKVLQKSDTVKTQDSGICLNESEEERENDQNKSTFTEDFDQEESSSSSDRRSTADTADSRKSTASRPSNSKGGNVTFEVAEFIAFAMYRLWNPKNIQKAPRSSAPSTAVASGRGHFSSCSAGSTSSATLGRKNAVTRKQRSHIPTPSISSTSTTTTTTTIQEEEDIESSPSKRLKRSPQKDPLIICPEERMQEWYPDYVTQIHSLLSLSRLSTPFIFLALLYVARLRQYASQYPLILATLPPHPEYPLFLACLMLSQKQNSDKRYSNRTWHKLSGMDLEGVNGWERRVLEGLRWGLHVRDDQYLKWVAALQGLGKEHALVLRSLGMNKSEVDRLCTDLTKMGKKDLVQDIQNARTANL